MPLPRKVATVLSLVALIAVGLANVGCLGGADESQEEFRSGAQRWGYNPWEPTGEEDPPTPIEPFPDHYRVEQIATGLDRPTQLAGTPDGRILVAEQAGNVRVVEDGKLLPEPLLSIDVYLPEREELVELGLTGLAVDPQFEQNGVFYVYYTRSATSTVVARASMDRPGDAGASLHGAIFTWKADPPLTCCHVAGGMEFAPDGTLIIGVGDNGNAGAAQDPFSPPGSVLRVNPDGTIPADNPFETWPVYAYGLRNPYDIAIDPQSGRIFAGENGFFGQDAVVEIKRGANYGWPGGGLRIPRDEIEAPLTFYHTMSGIAGMEFYSDDKLAALQGSLLYCRFHDGTIHELKFNDDGSVASETIRGDGCTTDITTGSDGFLYYLNYGEGALYRISN